MKMGTPGKNEKEEFDQIISVPLAADGRVGIEPGQNRIEVLVVRIDFLVETAVVPIV